MYMPGSAAARNAAMQLPVGGHVGAFEASITVARCARVLRSELKSHMSPPYVANGPQMTGPPVVAESIACDLFVMYRCHELNDSRNVSVKLKHRRPAPLPLHSWFRAWPFVGAPI